MISKLKTCIVFFLCIYNFNNAQEQSVKQFSIKENKHNLVVNAILQDDIGYLWLATNTGLYQYDGVSFSKKSTTIFSTLSLKQDTLFLGSHECFSFLKNQKITTLEDRGIQKIVIHNNIIYVAKEKGIATYKNGNTTPLQINKTIDTSLVYDILRVGEKTYIATSKGLWSLNNLNQPKNHQQIDSNLLVKLIENRKHIIGICKEQFLNIYSNEKILKTINLNNKITDVFKIDNEIWVLLDKSGIEVYDANNYTFLRKINKYNSSISDNVTTIYKDKDNNIWLGTKKDGVYKISSTATKNIEQPKLTLNSIEVNFNNIAFNPKETLILSANENNISFSFKTVSLENPNEIEYRYKLKGKYSNWFKQDFVSFSNLKPNNYQFYIQSKIGNRLSKEICIPFFIDVPFYSKGWFYIAIATIFFLVLFLIIEIRFRKIKRENSEKIKRLELKNHLITLEQKALQAQMNPHFIFNILNGIKAYGNTGQIITMNETISEFSVLLRSILNNSRTNEISLQEEINTIKNYVILEQKTNSKSFDYKIKTNLNNIAIDEILIPPMLIQPFIENSIKHGFKNNKKKNIIEIVFEVKQRFLHCSITDNGIGFYQSKKEIKNHKSIALEITKERIINLSVRNCFNIEEIKENDIINGTKVWFKIPLKTDY